MDIAVLDSGNNVPPPPPMDFTGAAAATLDARTANRIEQCVKRSAEVLRGVG